MRSPLFLYTLLACLFSSIHAQTVVFSENFNSLTPPNIPVGWVQHNMDGLTVHPSVPSALSTNAWISTNSFFHVPGPGDWVLISTSRYMSPATSDDWIVTPNITIPNSGATVLSWKAIAYDAFFPDGYLVKVITSGTNPSNYVTTTVAAISAENPTWTERSVDLTPWAGQTIRIAFQNNSTDRNLLGLNDVVVVQPLSSDVSVTAVHVQKYNSPTGTLTIQGTIKNLGASHLTHADIVYSVNGGSPVIMTVTGLNIPYSGSYNFTHATPYNFTGPGTYNVKVWTSNLSTGADLNTTNDTLSAQAVAVSSVPPKKAIIFEGTGAWCGACPDGMVVVEQVLNNYPNAIAIAVHNGDGMEIPDGQTINSTYSMLYPYATIDHYKFPTDGPALNNRLLWNTYMGTRLGHIVPAEISGSYSYNPSTRQLNVSVTATFRASVTGDFRLNCYLVEDSVIGPNTADYNQVNYYDSDVGHPFYGLGNPIIGFPHRHVLRAILGGPWGTPGSIPSTTTDGGIYTQNYTYTIPTLYDVVPPDINKMYLVYAIQEYNPSIEARPIHNALQQKISVPTTLLPAHYTSNQVKLYPNPALSQTNIELTLAKPQNVQIRILDLSGKSIKEWNHNNISAGDSVIRVPVYDLSAGIYLVNVQIGNQVFTEKIEIH